MTVLCAAPADVLAVWSGTSTWDNVIRAGEALRGLPAVANHVVVVTHQDTQGRWIGIQGQPGGVGLADCTQLLASRYTRSNHGQPRAGDQRQYDRFLAACAKSLGVGYDWVGIAEDTLTDLDVPDVAALIDPLWRWKPGQLPGHVVCSSLAAVLYEQVGWAHPDLGTERVCQPADWWKWSDGQEWK